MGEIIQTYNRIEQDINWLLDEIKKPGAWEILEENGKKLNELKMKLSLSRAGDDLEEIKKEMKKLADEYKVAYETAQVVLWLGNLFETANETLHGYKWLAREL